MKQGEKRRTWPGGYIHAQKDGRDLFIIERQVRGKGGSKRFHISTRTHNLRAAMKHLERFEANPEGYSPSGVAAEAPIYLNEELADAFRQWQLQSKGVSQKHANFVGNRLADWMEDLAGVDLRKATLRDHIIPKLKERTMRGARIAAIKVLFSWLRKVEHRITAAEDCTQDLMVPQSIPEKRRRRKAQTIETLRAVLPHLEAPYADCLKLNAATGWHWTEICRFIRDPESEIIRAQRGRTIAVLVTRHKRGHLTRTPVEDQDVLAAAERLRARGKVPKKHNDALRAACAKASAESLEKGGEPIPAFTFGVMRHTTGTLAVEAGASALAASEFLDHKDKRTFNRFYADVAVPAAVSVPSLLKN